MSWTLDYSGTTTPTVGTPVTLATDTNNGTLVVVIDTSNMAVGDIVQVTLKYITLSGGTAQIFKMPQWNGVQGDPIKISDPIPSDISLAVILNQSAGTAKAFPWKILRV